MNPDWLLSHFNEISEAPDAVPRLRRFILDLAVRGKVVEQSPDDEPAAELLKRILAKKQEVPGRRSDTKKSPLSISEGETPFEIPKSWEWVQSTEPAVVISDSGKKVQTKDVQESGEFPVVDQGKVLIRGYCNDAGKVIRVDEPIIVFGDHTRETKLIDFDFVVGADGVKVLKPIGINPAYYFLALQWLPLDSRGYGRHFKLLRASFIPLPPLAEQHRIVTKVDELMALCDELEAEQQKRERRRDRLVAAALNGLNNGNATTQPPSSSTSKESARVYFSQFPRLTTRPNHIQQLRQTILNLAVRGKLVPQDPNDEPTDSLISRIEAERKRRASAGGPVNAQALADSGDGGFTIPQSWRWGRLGFVTNVLMGQSPPGESYNTHGEGIPLINGPVEFSEGPFGITVLNQYTTAPTKLCKKGDLLLCVRGSTTGRTNIAGFDACIGRGVAALQPLYTDQFVRLFVWSWRDKIIEMGRGIAFPSISRQQIEDLPIPLPPLAEQHRIVAKVEELLALCDGLEAKLSTTATTRRQLLEATLKEGLSP